MNKGLEELIASAAAGLANRMYVFLEIRMDQPGATLYDLWYSAETYIHDLEADVVKARAEVERLRESARYYDERVDRADQRTDKAETAIARVEAVCDDQESRDAEPYVATWIIREAIREA